MKLFKFIFFILFFIGLGQNCKKENKPDEKMIYTGLVVLLATSNSSESYDCVQFTPNGFSSLVSFFESAPNPCSNCHSNDTRSGNFNSQDYQSVLQRVKIGDPENSLLFTKIKTGNMQLNANQNTRQAVYCWIQAGARN